jgi:hypothetical protein
MNINPVQNFGTGNADPGAELKNRPSPQPGPGKVPEREPSLPSKVSPPTEMPQDEVQVLRDAETNEEVAIKYLDRSGHVILQVPSEQLLEIARTIHQSLQQMEVRGGGSPAASGSEKGTSHGH